MSNNYKVGIKTYIIHRLVYIYVYRKIILSNHSSKSINVFENISRWMISNRNKIICFIVIMFLNDSIHF